MLSRVADSLYWMARYTERAEHTAQLIDAHLNLMLDQSFTSADQRWQKVLACLGVSLEEGAPRDSSSLLRLLAFDSASAASIVSCITSARENTRQVREQISSEMWEQMNKLFHEVRRVNMEDLNDAQPLDFLASVRNGIHLFGGLTDSTMSHGEGWHFIQLGRFLERATATATLLDQHVRSFGDITQWQEGTEDLEWLGLLKCCNAFEAYCKVYTAAISPVQVLEFLLLDTDFPHSMRFAVEQIQSALDAIEKASPTRNALALQNGSGKMRSSLSFCLIDEVLNGDLHAYLAQIQRQCLKIHGTLHEIYISYPVQSALEAH